MTAKRFTTRNGVFYTDTKTGYEFQCYGEVADIMNELAEENTTFREALKELKEIGDYQAMRIKELHEENQALKKLNIPIDEIKDTVSDYRGRIIGVYYND